MYITKIKLTNTRCFKTINLDLSNDGETIKWTTVLGDNATGKTTLLRSIAIGLCDETSAAGLLREIPWAFRKQNNEDEDAVIEIDLTDKKNMQYTIKTTIAFKKNIERVKRKIWNIQENSTIPDDEFQWDEIFVCGYGAGRGTDGTVDYLKYSTINAVYTLFAYDQPLQNPELAMRRLIQKFEESETSDSKNKALDWLKNQLRPILLLNTPQDDILLEKDGIWVENANWGKVPFAAIGDGYKGTLTWLMDLISWASLFADDIFDETIKGIVLIDEIEQHLHPKWQRTIVTLLRNAFPKIQFITTTHSPLVAADACKLLIDDLESKLFHLRFDGNFVQLSEIEEILGELNFDQILSSEAFDYIYDVSPQIEDILRQASILAAKGDQRLPDENLIYEKIKNEIKKLMFPEGKTHIERHIEREFYEELAKENEKLKKILYGKSS